MVSEADKMPWLTEIDTRRSAIRRTRGVIAWCKAQDWLAMCIELAGFDCYLSPNEGWTMASRDRYSRKLECSKCGHSGFAEASEQDEKRNANVDFRIDEMPAGFRTERPSVNPAEYMIRCAQCGNIFRFQQKVAYAPGGEPRQSHR